MKNTNDSELKELVDEFERMVRYRESEGKNQHPDGYMSKEKFIATILTHYRSVRDIRQALDGAYRLSINDMELHEFQTGSEPEVVRVGDIRSSLNLDGGTE